MATSGIHEKKYDLAFLSNWRTILGTTNHKEIGILYFIFALLNFLIAGTFALLIRIELFAPGAQLLDAKTYPSIFTMHGTAMIFFVIFPLNAAFGNYLVPTLVGARDMYWPRWNNAAFWMLVPGALIAYLGMANAGWTAYPPLSTLPEYTSVNFWILGLLLAGTSSLIAAINFIMTIFFMRKPDLPLLKMDLFTWSILITSFIQLFATPIITTGLILLLADRILNTSFFAVSGVAGPVLWQHIFWAYSHPAVYIMILPAMGITSFLISKFSRNEIFGYKSMVFSMAAISFLGMTVWGHHMYTVGVGAQVDYFFTFVTFLIAVPSGIKMFNWIFTMYGSKIKLEIPMLFAVAFLIGFLFGGLTGVILNVTPVNLVIHDTYWVIGHFHFVIIGGGVSAMFGLIYYLFPRVTGKMYNRKLAQGHFWLWFIGFMLAFTAMGMLGAMGMPRRYFDYSLHPEWTFLNQVATIGALFMGTGILLWVINMIQSILKGPPADELDPFGIGEITITEYLQPSH